MTTKLVFITSGTSFTAPSDLASVISIECIGAGGGAASGGSSGGGGGGYSKTTSFALVASTAYTIQVGVGGNSSGTNGTATFFNSSGTVQGAGGQGSAATGNGGLGGAGSGGSTNFTGGAGETAWGSAGCGGGGAAGPGGNGGKGGGNPGQVSFQGGSGGGGASGGAGAADMPNNTNTGGNGGNNSSATGGGVGGAAGAHNGGAATAAGAGGGGGGGDAASLNVGAGGAGSAGIDWDATHGAGGGGGGGGGTNTGIAGAGAPGSLYGGGAGGGGSGGTNGAGAAGANGLIVVTYTVNSFFNGVSGTPLTSAGTFAKTVTKASSGVAASPAANQIVTNVVTKLNSSLANSAANSFAFTITKPLTGVAANPTINSFTTTVSESFALTGVAANPALGNFSTHLLVGVGSNPAIGALAITASGSTLLPGVAAHPNINTFNTQLSSVATDPAIGLPTIHGDNIRPLIGVAANAALGTIQPVHDNIRLLTSVAANPALGLFRTSDTIRFPSVAASPKAGDFNRTKWPAVVAHPKIGAFTVVGLVLPQSFTSFSAEFSNEFGDISIIPAAPAPPPIPPPPLPPQQTSTQAPTTAKLPSSGPIPALPNRISLANSLLSTMGGLSGVITNYTQGSLFRNFALAQGAELERQGIISSTKVTQNVAYSLMNLFDVSASAAIRATGIITFTVPVASRVSIAIPQGTKLLSNKGIQFQTTQAAVIFAGQLATQVPIQAVVGGISGNVAANTINRVITGLSVPLLSQNLTPTSGGINQQSISVALADLAAKIASLNLGSPVSIANACVGVFTPDTHEVVKFSTVTEQWISQIVPSNSIRGFVPTPGFNIYVDNGAGTASSALLDAVKKTIDGDLSAGLKGYRPVGVPYSVNATVPVLATLTISGTTATTSNATVASGLVQSAIIDYFSNLEFGQPAYASELSAQLVNAGLGLINSLTTYLYYNSNLNTQVTSVTGAAQTRILLAPGSPAVNITGPLPAQPIRTEGLTSFVNGTNVFATWTNTTGTPLSFIDASVTVPPYPTDETGTGNLVLWIGFQSGDGKEEVLAPILKFYPTDSIEGAPFQGIWAINNVHQINTPVPAASVEKSDSFIVTPGTILTPFIELMSIDTNGYTYRCGWLNYPSIDLSVTRDTPFNITAVSFESYETSSNTTSSQLTSFDKLPATPSTTFSNISVDTQSGTSLFNPIAPVWITGQAITTFGQTIQVNNNNITVYYRGLPVQGNEVFAVWANSGSPISLMSATFTVPAAPLNTTGIVYLKMGIGSGDGTLLLQPVLKWNNGWQILTQLTITPNVGPATVHIGGTASVSPGQVLTGQLILTNNSGGQFVYTAGFVGFSSIDFNAILGQGLANAAVSLEAYETVWQTKQLTTCSKLPNSVSTTFSAITFHTVSSNSPTISWTPGTGVAGSINCGQTLNVVDNATITITY